MLRLTLFAIFLLSLVQGLILQGDSYYKKVVHNTDPEARCLDGSPALIYVHEGGLKDHILLFFMGGGICPETTMDKSLESCYQRSKDFLGSSNPWPDYLPTDIPELTSGYLSADPNKNGFANWTKFFIPYCDGNLHHGNRIQPIKYKDAKLYFRGSVITRSQFKWVDSTYGLKNASKIILTGMSAGGIATNTWSNYLKDFVGDANKVYSISDSGLFENFKTFQGEPVVEQIIKNSFALVSVDEPFPLSDCYEVYGEQSWRCAFSQYAYPFIKGRFMVVNSEYDSWAINYYLNLSCIKNGTSGQTIKDCNETEIAYIEQYRKAYMFTLNNFRNFNDELSVWSIACAEHVYACFQGFYDNQHQKIPANTGKTVREAIEAFVLHDQKTVSIDFEKWPANSGCAK